MNTTTLDDAPLHRFHYRLLLCTGGGPFIDGYILAIIGVAMIQIGPRFELSPLVEGLVGATALVGIFFGAALGGYLGDRFGRQRIYNWDLIAIAVLSVAQFWITDAIMLVVVRLLIGIAIGADYPLASSLMTEFSPKRYRGPFLGILIAAFFAGGAAAYLVGELLLPTGDDAWRWMLASSVVPTALIALARLKTPESPRWLANQGRDHEAAAVVTKVFGPGVVMPPATVDEAKSSVGFVALFRSGYGGRLAFVTTFWTCAIIPVFAIFVFGPQILAAMKLEGSASTVGSAAIQAIFLVGCIIALLLVNRMGRRAVIIHSFLWSGLALLLLGLFPGSTTLMIAALFVIYALAAGGAQILCYVYPNELFPTHIRGAAVGLASALSRIGAAIGTFLVPLSLTTLGTSATLLIATAITAVGLVVSLIWAPETRGLDLAKAASINTDRDRTSK
ncbi:MFS transporter [Rhodococcus pseudokoreensis]|uniref:MFS transporter n=1 Tax=Rhodococcus pseudokoreensis TaxID=2811421 RepID=A0A974ZYT9_9NOCA|nr:MFS transporter [Rhodococcus pseudokoreensis]